MTNLKLLNDLCTFLTIADVVWLQRSYRAWLQLNKRVIKQPATFSKPNVRTNFHTQKLQKTNYISVPNGPRYERSMVRTVHVTNSLWYK